MYKTNQRLTYWVLGLLLLAGLTLWWGNYNARGLFLDEANLALNVAELSWLELFGPLRYEQYAPPLYLLLLKALGETFGYDEAILRLPALLGGLMTIGGIWLAGRRLGLGGWVLAPLAFCFISSMVLRYVSELKPYALDMGVAALLMAWALRRPQPRWFHALAAGLLIWISFPAVFCIAPVVLYAFLQNPPQRTGWLLVSASALVSFVLLYLLLLSGESKQTNLQDHHAAYFFPWRLWTSAAWEKATSLLQLPLKHGFGFTVLAQVGGAAGIVGLLLLAKKSDWPKIGLLLGPYLLALAASVLGKYTLIPRLMLFSLPGWWLAAAWGWRLQQGRLNGYWRWIPPAVVLLLLPGTNVIRHYHTPLRVGQVREMLAALPADRPVFVDYWAVPSVRYYREVHHPPLGPNITYHYCENQREMQAGTPPYSLLYSMRTIPSVTEYSNAEVNRLRADSLPVRTTSFFRGLVVVVD